MKTDNPWLELIRPANCITALADIAAGYAISGADSAISLTCLLPATVCLYAGGIVLNDYFDRNLDALERPERPLPSGRISPDAARNFGAALLFAGVISGFLANFTAGLIALAIGASVLLYDARGKHFAFFGPLNMGVCRGLNLLLGIAAVPAAIHGNWQLAILPLAYIAAVTALSRGEVRGGKKSVALGALIAILAIMLALAGVARKSPTALLALLLFLLSVLPHFWRAYLRPEPVFIRRAIRSGVLSLVLLDATLAAAYSGLPACLIVLALAMTARAVSRLFEVT